MMAFFCLAYQVKLSGGTLTGTVSERLMPVIKMRRPDLVLTIEVPEFVHATHAKTLNIETEAADEEEEEEEAAPAAAEEVDEEKPPAAKKVSLGRTAVGARAGSSVIFDGDGGCACWLLPLGTAGNPPPPAGWLQKNLEPHLTVLQEETSGESGGRSVRQYCFATKGEGGSVGEDVPIVVEEREALSDGGAALLGDSAWGAALALAAWVALNPSTVTGRRVVELVRKTPLFEPFIYKCIMLPRQARDKHRETLKKRRFLQGAGVGLPALAASLAVGGGVGGAKEVVMTDMYPELLQLMERNLAANGQKTVLFQPFIYKSDHFIKTGSGHT
jgi:predicted nicotinamide N-methyase